MPRRLANYIKKIVKSTEEKKVVDYFYNTTVSTDGVLFDIGQFKTIQQGTEITQRTGLSIDLHSVQLRGLCLILPPQLSDLPASLNVYMRLIIFQWFSDPFVDQPSISDILWTFEGTPSNGRYYNPFSFYNKESAGKFSILLDKVYSLDLNGKSLIPINYRFKSMPLKTIPYRETEIGSGEYYPTTGNIYGIILSDIDDDPELFQLPEIVLSFRTTYTDS